MTKAPKITAQDWGAETRAELDKLADLMAARGMIMPSADFLLKSHKRDATILLCYAAPTSNYADKYKHFRSEDLASALRDAEAWVLSQPTAEEKRVHDALELTAKALEAARAAGLDTGAGAAFVAQLEGLMKTLSENVLTDQREAE